MSDNDKLIFDYFQRLFRHAIADQIQEFKNQCFKDTKFVNCASTGLQIPKQLCEIDHEHPHTFAALVFDFLDKRFVNGVHCFFYEKLESILEEWKIFHKKHAKLRAVYCTVNNKEPKVYPEWEKLALPFRDRSNEWAFIKAYFETSLSHIVNGVAHQRMLDANSALDWIDLDREGWLESLHQKVAEEYSR